MNREGEGASSEWWVGLPGGVHRLRDAEKLALHRLIAARLRADPEGVLTIAKANLDRWMATDRESQPYHQEWVTLLRLAVPQLVELITAESEEGYRLRQTSPFAGILSAAEREAAFLAARRCEEG